MGDGGFHRLGGLQHLGHDQLIVVEQPPHLAHARHQRAIDDIERRRAFGALSLQVFDQPVARALNDVVRQPLVERQVRRARPFLLLGRPEMIRDRCDVQLVHRDALFAGLLPPVGGNIAQQRGPRMICRHILRRMLEEQILRQSPLMFRNGRKSLDALRIDDCQIKLRLRAVV